MRVLKLLPLFSLFFVLGGQVMFLPVEIYAGFKRPCCTSCPCVITCICPGPNQCPYFTCHSANAPTVQGQTVVSNKMLDLRGSYDSRPSPSFRPISIDRLITPASSGQCARNNFLLKFFQGAEEQLKFDSDFLNYNVGQDNSVVAFLTSIDEEK